ncbi:MAG: DNA repair protein RadA [Acidiferrobacteraceae bacterium]|jgi:DNA repair protein RadA/Sms
MARPRTVFVCNACGAQTPKWVGQCPGCGAWNTLEESVSTASAAGVGPREGLAPGSEVQSLEDVRPEHLQRMPTGSAEMDRVLGGGLVAGSVVLLGGDPGIGKSTLLIQLLDAISTSHPVLYVTGEESAEQIALRAHRLGLKHGSVRLLAENRVEHVSAVMDAEQARVVVIDSIQTAYTDLLQSAPGSVSQVRESAAQLVRLAKRRGISLFLVGHVTKEGNLAGPRVLEHMVDTVLYFEGDTSSSFRLIRAFKNRFGAVNEVGVFLMSEKGLQGVSNPSAMFVSRHGDAVPGSVVLATQEGSRPLLVEVQALVEETHLAQPRRVCVGLESQRLAMLLALLHRHGGLPSYDRDVFVNVAGGIRVGETAADLAMIAAVVSSMRDRPLGNDLVVFGEVGLAGEIRPVQGGQERLREAAKMGLKRALIPYANRPKSPIPGLEVIPVRRLNEVMPVLRGD